MEYRVTWTIDVDADNPEDAARKARQYQLNPNAAVGHFSVLPHGARLSIEIDLDEIDGRA